MVKYRLSQEILNLYKEGKWFRIVPSYSHNPSYEKTTEWCRLYPSNGAYATGRGAMWIEKEADAVMFALKWA